MFLISRWKDKIFCTE